VIIACVSFDEAISASVPSGMCGAIMMLLSWIVDNLFFQDSTIARKVK
jgi:hypothetical protein